MSPTKKQLVAITGGLGNPSKMPGFSYGISPANCLTGSKLAKVPGSICSDCYACKGNYRFTGVKNAHKAREENLGSASWIAAMAMLILRETARTGELYFRWHDSGDLQSFAHLKAIVEVCQLTPKVKHWLPTRERKIVAQFVREAGQLPSNLAVRVSATFPDRPVAPMPADVDSHVGYSNVHKNAEPAGRACPARTQGNSCGDCRACWSLSNKTISYPIH